VERGQRARRGGHRALTERRRALFVEKVPIPLGGKVIEFPAGLVGDEPGREQEDLIEARATELLEETGYRAATLRLF